MGYNIEVSFDLVKNTNVTDMEQYIETTAKECNCSFIYSYCEMDNKLFMQRNHMVMTTFFENQHMNGLLRFLKTMKKTKGICVESIYNEENHEIIYASQYYLTIMDKGKSNTFQQTRKIRSYSEDDIRITKEIKHTYK